MPDIFAPGLCSPCKPQDRGMADVWPHEGWTVIESVLGTATQKRKKSVKMACIKEGKL